MKLRHREKDTVSTVSERDTIMGYYADAGVRFTHREMLAAMRRAETDNIYFDGERTISLRRVLDRSYGRRTYSLRYTIYRRAEDGSKYAVTQGIVVSLDTTTGNLWYRPSVRPEIQGFVSLVIDMAEAMSF